MKINVYVDGFNLYYGALKNTPYKWLDLDALCRLLLPRDNINRIRYFTARVSSRPHDLDAPTRQDAYLRALASLPSVQIHYGHFLLTKTRMALASPVPKMPATVEVLKTEEKGSDVNLATYLMRDAFMKEFEAAALITNDSDLLEPIKIIRSELKLTVGVIVPHRKASVALAKEASFVKQIRPGVLAMCQLPNPVRTTLGDISRPKSW